MAFIRNRTEERTGIQNGGFIPDSIDMHCDFAMVYRIDETTTERIALYKEKGYVVHLMTGISWGKYLDYLDGRYDGVNHWDEAQCDRNGNPILHSADVPYMVPTLAFTDYLTEKLKVAVDAGVEAIHVEEPEFWDRAGYSEGFKREFELYYKSPWIPPHQSVDARYKCAKLKQYLFTRAIDRVSAALKAHAKIKYQRSLRFYVPTHSLVNYTQWKIVSPEGKLADIPGVDGCIAQVWTGTAREKNWYEGTLKERTFETAFLEYGVMQELVKGTGRHMWFLHDPIEDNPAYDWNDYRRNYLATVVASLLHPGINTYEISPWPNRVFEEKYPKNSPDAMKIPPEYATLLNNMFNTLGNMECAEQKGVKVGILTGDSQLYQRTYPDSEFSFEREQKTGTVLKDDEKLLRDFREKLFESTVPDKEQMLLFAESAAFPAFYGLALPLIKYGIPLRPVLADNVRRYAGYLDDCNILIVSYDFMKPDYPDINLSLAEWVHTGGVLIYVGNGFDPYTRINSWWTGKYASPEAHLFRMLGIDPQGETEIFHCGKGLVGVWQENPCCLSFSKTNADRFRRFVKDTVTAAGLPLTYDNCLEQVRTPYILSAVLNESVSETPKTYEGLFADMFTPDFKIISKKTVLPGEQTMLCELNKIEKSVAVIGTSVRIFSLDEQKECIILTMKGASLQRACLRLKIDFIPDKAFIDGEPVILDYDTTSSTVLLTFENKTGERKLILYKVTAD